MVEGHLEAHHEIREATIRAYDKGNGDLIAQIPLPANATGAPMTYMYHANNSLWLRWVDQIFLLNW